MSHNRELLRTACEPCRTDLVTSRRWQLSFYAKKFGIVLIIVVSLAGIVFAQSQTTAPTPASPDKPTASTPNAVDPPKPKPTKSKPKKVYTDEDMAGLPRAGISVTGSAATATNASPKEGEAQANAPASPAGEAPAEGDAKAAAYWRGRFTVVRQKLADDEKALPGLENKLETERVNEWSGNKGSGQVHSSEYMDALHKLEELHATIEKDKQALSDLQEEFRHAGGQPGWIR